MTATGSISTELNTKLSLVEGIQFFFQMQGHALLQGEIISNSQIILKIFKKTSALEPLGKFQSNMAQSILGWWGFKFALMKSHIFFQRVIIANLLNAIENIEKQIFFWTTEPISTTLDTRHSWIEGIQVYSIQIYSNEGSCLSLSGDNNKIVIILTILKNSTQVSNMAHKPLVVDHLRDVNITSLNYITLAK